MIRYLLAKWQYRIKVVKWSYLLIALHDADVSGNRIRIEEIAPLEAALRAEVYRL